MPKITTDTVKIAGNFYEIHIFYSETEGGFFVKNGLPDSMIGIVEVNDLMPVSRSKREYGAPHFENIGRLRVALKKLIETFETKIKQRRKVIVFTLNIQEKTMEIIAPELPTDRFRVHKFQGYGDDFGFIFGYQVAYEYVTGNKIEYTKKETRSWMGEEEKTVEINLSVSKDTTVIDWTAENEAFFDKMAESVNSLSKMVFDFFNRDNEELGALIESSGEGKAPFLLTEKTD